MDIIIIAAMTYDRVIGKNGKIPWHIKEELQFFKKTTYGFPIIMGRKTYESLGKPLPGRLNIIVTRNNNFFVEDEQVKIFNNIENALEFCKEVIKSEKVFIIGGAEIYSQCMKYANMMILSFVKISSDGDTFFPEYNKEEWELEKKEEYQLFETHYLRRKYA